MTRNINSTIIACAMMEDELEKVYKKTGCSMPVIWLERGYHNTPEQLNKKLQDTILSLQDMDEILLTFGLCGNGTNGIISPKATLVLPKFDDCINMLLCNKIRHTRGLTETGSIYLTNGWILDKESILKQHEENIENYGEEAATDILELMYQQYKNIVVIDTDSFDTKPVLDYAQKAASLLNLSTNSIKGSTLILEQLITRQWNENFIIQKPGEILHASQWEFSSTCN